MIFEAEKQYRRYLHDCLDTYELLKAKTCPAEDDDYAFWNQRNNPRFYADILFPIFEDCDVKFIEFSYENLDKLIKENELYWTIAFNKRDLSRVKEWFIANTNLDFSIDCTHPSFSLMRILADDIVNMLYSKEVKRLENCLKESSEQCEEDEGIFNYTEPSYCILDGDWTFNEM